MAKSVRGRGSSGEEFGDGGNRVSNANQATIAQGGLAVSQRTLSTETPSLAQEGVHRARHRLLRSRQLLLGGCLLGLLVLAAVFAPFLTHFDPVKILPADSMSPPSARHWMGTDQFGRDIMARVLYGGRISLSMGIVALVFAFGLGIILGLAAGFYGGWTDLVIMRLTDVMLAFPTILLGIFIAATLGPSLNNVMIATGISWSPAYIRYVRGLTLQLKSKDYIDASRALGCSDLRLMAFHVLPNLLPSLIVFASLALGGTILAAAGLSFLGLGAQPPTPEWGALLNNGRDFLRDAWWMGGFPGFAITLTVVGANLIGDGLRDVLDPRRRL